MNQLDQFCIGKIKTKANDQKINSKIIPLTANC